MIDHYGGVSTPDLGPHRPRADGNEMPVKIFLSYS